MYDDGYYDEEFDTEEELAYQQLMMNQQRQAAMGGAG